MTSSGPHGFDRVESATRTDRSGRRGSGWPQLGRRAEPAAEGELRTVELRAVEPRAPEAAGEEHLGDRLTAFVDGELDHETRERVQAHLATCPDCLARVDQARAVKQRLTDSGSPAPSDFLRARLLAVAALPDDGPGDGGMGSVLGGSRLTGGSFGRGPGAGFGRGALGAESPIPGIDPRAFPGAHRSPLAAAARPLAALAELPVVRSPHPRGRRLVVAAAGAFSVAAVTLGGVGGIGPTITGDGQHGTTVTPVSDTSGAFVPVDDELPVPPHHSALVVHSLTGSSAPSQPLRLDHQDR